MAGPEDPPPLWDRLMDAWDAESPACMLELARTYTAENPTNFAGWIALADVLSRAALYDDARAALRRAQRFSPSRLHPMVWIQLGHHYKNKCDLRRAAKWYQRAVDEQPTTDALVFLGVCLAKQGRFVPAKACHRKAIELATSVVDEAHYNLGLVLRAEGRYSEAIDSFDAAVALDPDYKLAHQAREDCIAALRIRLEKATPRSASAEEP